MVTGPCALIESNYKFSTNDEAIHRLLPRGKGAENECALLIVKESM